MTTVVFLEVVRVVEEFVLGVALVAPFPLGAVFMVGHRIAQIGCVVILMFILLFRSDYQFPSAF